MEREEGEGNSRKRRRRRGGKRFALPREPSNWPSIEPIDGGRARQRRRLSAGPSRAAERCLSRPRREGYDTPYAPREWNRCRQRLLRWEKTGSPRLLPTSDNARAEASIETKTRLNVFSLTSNVASADAANLDARRSIALCHDCSVQRRRGEKRNRGCSTGKRKKRKTLKASAEGEAQNKKNLFFFKGPVFFLSLVFSLFFSSFFYFGSRSPVLARSIDHACLYLLWNHSNARGGLPSVSPRSFKLRVRQERREKCHQEWRF